ncbi:hypothetical protein [Inmirania thermothiophila]|uniref:Alpha/beta hydrolase family protein DUF900 n=1 Tax=Inmirania thermothiophila TaxID=1750597 RepID=A0A3N1Y8A5_9GAMM|nr:hypothetical protein [Inmirania thermothiophila]ROR35044.1 hypothetical protein EDC57_0961 [Inmirania thermothiophila]
MAAKRILLVHGLASKPPARDLHALWTRCLTANLRAEAPQAVASLGRADLEALFETVYWANAVPSHLEDPPEAVAALRRAVDRVIRERRRRGGDFHIRPGARFKAFVKDRAVDLVDALSTALTIKDEVVQKVLEEVRLYAHDQYVADRIRAPLEQALRRAWDEGAEVAVLAHSMGTFVAYDVLWRFSWRSEPEYAAYRDRRVALFATLGSPLGDREVQRLLFGERYRGEARRFPVNVRRWHNYAALGDIVAHDSTLTDDFFAPMRSLGLLGPEEEATRDYVRLANPYVSPRTGRPNPHKSYGYLVQPKLAKWLGRFLEA